LDLIYKNMARILLRSREFISAAIILLLVGVVALSIATRRPCLHVHSAPWHTWEAGHMNTAEGHETCAVPVSPTSYAQEIIPPSLAISRYVPREEVLLSDFTITLQIRKFRAPPVVG
jgi:hypothetical protein